MSIPPTSALGPHLLTDRRVRKEKTLGPSSRPTSLMISSLTFYDSLTQHWTSTSAPPKPKSTTGPSSSATSPSRNSSSASCKSTASATTKGTGSGWSSASRTTAAFSTWGTRTWGIWRARSRSMSRSPVWTPGARTGSWSWGTRSAREWSCVLNYTDRASRSIVEVEDSPENEQSRWYPYRLDGVLTNILGLLSVLFLWYMIGSDEIVVTK